MTYIRNINNLYRTFWKIPILKELTETLKGQSIQLLHETLPGSGLGSGDDKTSIKKTEFLQALLQCSLESEELTHEIELEFQQLIYSIMFIKKKSDEAFNTKNTIETNEILKALIRITDATSGIEKNSRQISLKVLRKMIEMENKDFTTPAAEWESEDWEKYEY